MKIQRTRIIPCLWFAEEAEEAARFYASVFRNSAVGRTTQYGKEGFEIHGRAEGSVLTVDFELDGHPFTALNGGPVFTFNEAISFQVICDSQEEVDYYWERLSEGGERSAQQCGWLKDRFGVSWQIIPDGVQELLHGQDAAGSQRAMHALLQMRKLDLAELERAYRGEAEPSERMG